MARSPTRERNSLVKVKQVVDFRWVVAAALLPLVLMGLLALGVQIHDLVRYDPAYFSETYVERYGAPGAAARALERALQAGEQALLAELQGLQRTAAFETSPDMIFIMLWERGDRYISYLYFDMQTYERHMHYFEQVKGRWVVTPLDAHYYLHSGRWLRIFLPVAIVWWALEVVVVLSVALYRVSARLRAQMYGGQGQS
jgi:hypothetical protein